MVPSSRAAPVIKPITSSPVSESNEPRAGNVAGRGPAVDQRRSQPCRHPVFPSRSGRADPSRPPEVEAAISDPACTIVDVRTEAEYRGDRFWPSGGFEPGGVRVTFPRL